MLCGRPPFDSKSQFELMLAHVSQTPAPPSAIVHDLPKFLDAIVRKALSKDPAARFQTAAEFSATLATEAAEPVPEPAPVWAAPPEVAVAPEPVAVVEPTVEPEPVAAVAEPVPEVTPEPEVVAAAPEPEPVTAPVVEPEPEPVSIAVAVEVGPSQRYKSPWLRPSPNPSW
jgi:hypothetical protein